MNSSASPPLIADPLEQLVARGRAAGYVTYDDINDAMPMPEDDTIDQTAEVDRWLARLMAEGIEVRAN